MFYKLREKQHWNIEEHRPQKVQKNFGIFKILPEDLLSNPCARTMLILLFSGAWIAKVFELAFHNISYFVYKSFQDIFVGSSIIHANITSINNLHVLHLAMVFRYSALLFLFLKRFLKGFFIGLNKEVGKSFRQLQFPCFPISLSLRISRLRHCDITVTEGFCILFYCNCYTESPHIMFCFCKICFHC